MLAGERHLWHSILSPQINLGLLRELASEHAFLFADTPSLVLKAADDLTALIKLRIAEHEQAEAAKAEALRARIAEEERVKAEAAERARVAAETKRQLDEQAAAVAAARAQEAAAAKAAQAASAPEPVPQQEALAAPAAPVTPIDVARGPAPEDGSMLRLGQINERLAPIVLTADGLARLGFAHALSEKSAKLYRESDFQRICAALIRHVDRVSQQAKAA